MRKNKLTLFAVLLGGLIAGLTACKPKPEVLAAKPEKLADYLYYMELDGYTFDAMPPEDSEMFTFGCSSIRKGNLYGRNLDLGYCETPEFIIRLAPSEDRFASLSVCADPTITSKVEEMTEEDFRNMPNITNDGINENGVIVNVNVVDTQGADDQKGTAPGKETIHASRIVRYLLDHAKSAEHAVELMENLDIVGGFSGYGLHWMIADEEDTYVVEIIDGKICAAKNEQFYMTNFYLNYGPEQAEQYIAGTCFENVPLLNENAIGVERWCILRDGYEAVSSQEDMAKLMESVRGTAMYDRENAPGWYSECCCGDISIHSEKEVFDAALEEQIGWFESRDRSNPKGDWITWHTSIYDIEARTMVVYSQEDYSKEFKAEL